MLTAAAWCTDRRWPPGCRILVGAAAVRCSCRPVRYFI